MRYLQLVDFKRLKNAKLLNFPRGANLRQNLQGVSIDSRTLRAGEVFWAITGERLDGHNYIAEAVRKGAAAIVLAREQAHRFAELPLPQIIVPETLHALQEMASLHRKRFRIPVIGITGTNGKTTTKEMIAWILQNKFRVLKTRGNLNNHIGVPLTLLELHSEHEVAIIEMGTNHPGEIKQLCKIAGPTAGLITNIGRGHLEFFATLEGVSREKTQLFSSVGRRGIIYLNLDDENLPRFPGRKKSLWSYSLAGKPKARVTGKLAKLNSEGAGRWKLNEREFIQLHVAGLHNVNNALAAATVALSFGFSEREIKKALEKYVSYDKRMQIIRTGGLTIINDAYNSNPDSFIKALETLNHIAKEHTSRRIVVMGDMLELGLESEALHQELLISLLDFDIEGIFTLGKASNTAGDVLRYRGFDRVYSFTSHEQLGKELKKFCKKGDTLLLKGSRGMQMEKVLAYL